MKRRVIVIVSLIIGLAVFNFGVQKQYVTPILMYHKIDKAESRKGKLAVSPEVFEKQMSFLARNKYNVISLQQLIGLIKNKEKIPHNTVVITFDDGYENNYSAAFPVLKKYNLKATIFVIADFITKPGYMTEAQLKELSDSGLITIASHTFTHPVLTKIDAQAANYEITQSKDALEVIIKKPVKLFSYPLGAFNEAIRAAVIKETYLGAVATNPGKKYPKDDIYALKRMRIAENAGNMFIFWVQTTGYYTFIKEHRDD